MLLARTNWDVPKHRGLSFFFLPMKQSGVEVRPLRQVTDEAGAVTSYAYDTAGLLARVRIPGGPDTMFTHRGGLLSGVRRGDGTALSYRYLAMAEGTAGDYRQEVHNESGQFLRATEIRASKDERVVIDGMQNRAALKFDRDGRLIAVDGYATFREKQPGEVDLRVPPKESLRPIFEPRGIAVVGVSTQDSGKSGNIIVKNLAGLGREMMARYRDKTCMDALKQAEPFTGVRKVEVENLLEAWRDQIDAQTVAAPPPAAPPTEVSPGETAPAAISPAETPLVAPPVSGSDQP